MGGLLWAEDVAEGGIAGGYVNALFLYRALDGGGVQSYDLGRTGRWLRETWKAIRETLCAPLQDFSGAPRNLRFVLCKPQMNEYDIRCRSLQNQ